MSAGGNGDPSAFVVLSLDRSIDFVSAQERLQREISAERVLPPSLFLPPPLQPPLRTLLNRRPTRCHVGRLRRHVATRRSQTRSFSDQSHDSGQDSRCRASPGWVVRRVGSSSLRREKIRVQKSAFAGNDVRASLPPVRGPRGPLTSQHRTQLPALLQNLQFPRSHPTSGFTFRPSGSVGPDHGPDPRGSRLSVKTRIRLAVRTEGLWRKGSVFFVSDCEGVTEGAVTRGERKPV